MGDRGGLPDTFVIERCYTVNFVRELFAGHMPQAAMDAEGGSGRLLSVLSLDRNNPISHDATSCMFYALSSRRGFTACSSVLIDQNSGEPFLRRFPSITRRKRKREATSGEATGFWKNMLLGKTF